MAACYVCSCCISFGVWGWLSVQMGLPKKKKKICLQYRRRRLDPWVRKIPWRKRWQPTPVFLPGKSHGQRSLVATVHRVSQGKTWLSMHASHLVCSDDQINTIPISLSKDVQKSFLEILGAPYHVLTHKNFEFVEFSLVGRADGLLRSEAHLWLWVDIFCVDIVHLLEILLLLLFSLLSPMHFLLLLRGSGISFVDKRRKNNDSFGFAERPRSFVPREIRKFIKWAPAEVLKRGRKCLSFIFIHEALEGDRKGDWRLGDQAASQTVGLRRHLQSCEPGCLRWCAYWAAPGWLLWRAVHY